MKQILLKTLVVMIVLLVGAGNALYAGTYASGIRITNPDSTIAFDGSFHDGTNARIWFTLNGHADTVLVRIKSGNTVVRAFPPLLNDTARTYSIAWDGKNDQGNIVLTGRYMLEVFTSDTGNSSSTWAKAWQNKVRSGLSSRDIEVVNVPGHPWFGNLILSEAFSPYSRLIVASAAGDSLTSFGTDAYISSSDPWYLTTSQNGNLYASNNSRRNIFVFQNGLLVQTLKDTAGFDFPRGIAALGGGSPTLLIATGNRLVRRSPAGVVDTVFQTAGAGYVRDVVVDDSGYVYFSYGGSSTTYTNVSRGRLTVDTMFVLDTLVLPARVTHMNVFRGTNFTSNADDIIYARVRDASGGVFKLDFAAKTSTKLFLPDGSTATDNIAIATDYLGNIYYANASNEWVRMYVPPSSVPTKLVSSLPVSVSHYGTKIIDAFDKTAGHFNVAPNYSGSTAGIDASSTAAWTPMYSASGNGGSVEVRLVDNPALTTDLSCRFLSGVGAPTSNDSLAPFGWVGYWMKTNTAPPGAMVAIGIDDPSDPATKRSVMLPVISDGEWHLYQWNIEDISQWTPWVVTSGLSKIKGPRASIDAVWFFAPNGSQPWVLNLDNVSYNPYGRIGEEVGRGDVTGNGFVSVLDASWVLQHAVATRTLDAKQIFVSDVNLSHEGTATDAVDASVMLAHVVGKIPFLPWKQALPPMTNVNENEAAPISLIIASAKGNSGRIVTIPISVPQELAGLRSAEMKIEFNSSQLKVLSISTVTLTKDFALASNVEKGSVSIAMASGEAILHGGQILTIEAEVLQTSENINFTVRNILLNDIQISKVTSVGGGQIKIPDNYALFQNYPNPFNPSTTIEYQLPNNGFVDLKIYDITGREIFTLVSDLQDAGTHRIMWNATDHNGVRVASGVYFYRIIAGNFTQIKKMVLLK